MQHSALATWEDGAKAKKKAKKGKRRLGEFGCETDVSRHQPLIGFRRFQQPTAELLHIGERLRAPTSSRGEAKKTASSGFAGLNSPLGDGII
ncbi:MAG: hypothetical protein C4532_03950 [Candidatus Abyssobacteria bacterium SURF_17]|uniref:Uncharacterized protein n=1 Tax=Candidatus Abyssobacteria bacterium SURF_17 TaxID=2093361 RepID=A0A419F620_9BACT|nr:MAG: hypothetical protein C4532_03950 [Candidatus Abyssubacteria bacterium SURF_17]